MVMMEGKQAGAEEFADLESQDTGKARASRGAAESLRSIGQLRFLAGAGRGLAGQGGSELRSCAGSGGKGAGVRRTAPVPGRCG